MLTDISFWAYTLSFVGKLLIIITTILVHKKVGEEKKIDDIVIKDIHLEMYISVIAIILIVTGYLLHIVAL
ncbi:MAG: hypothetical protein ACMXX9_04245 [Candidatus Woesearchaeota archaeon]